jgi:hypothetical protein
MAKIEYRPGKVEFYAPDTFERDSLNCCYMTTDNAVAAKGNYVLTSNCDGALTFADCADSTAYGLANVCVSGVDVVRDRIEELEEKVRKLALAIETRDYGVVDLEKVKARRETHMERLRRELRTLQIAF